jgi:hypothetical protein
MRKAETSEASRARTDVAGVVMTGFALPVIIGLSLTVVGPAAADAPNKQSFTAAQAQTAPANVMSFKGATTLPIAKSRIRPALLGSASARSNAAPNAAAVAAFTAAVPQPASAAARAAEQPKLGAALLPANGGPAANASRPAEQLQAGMAARPAIAGNEALLHPVAAALKNNAALPAAVSSNLGAAPAAAAVVPTPPRALASGAVRTAMLTPSSTMAADRSATTELLRSKAAVNALRKAQHDAAAHHR